MRERNQRWINRIHLRFFFFFFLHLNRMTTILMDMDMDNLFPILSIVIALSFHLCINCIFFFPLEFYNCYTHGSLIYCCQMFPIFSIVIAASFRAPLILKCNTKELYIAIKLAVFCKTKDVYYCIVLIQHSLL